MPDERDGDADLLGLGGRHRRRIRLHQVAQLRRLADVHELGDAELAPGIVDECVPAQRDADVLHLDADLAHLPAQLVVDELVGRVLDDVALARRVGDLGRRLERRLEVALDLARELLALLAHPLVRRLARRRSWCRRARGRAVADADDTAAEYEPVCVKPNLMLSRFSSFTASAMSSCVVTCGFGLGRRLERLLQASFR